MATRTVAANGLLIGLLSLRSAAGDVLSPPSASAQLISDARSAVANQQLFSRRQALAALFLNDLIDKTAPIGPNAFVKYGGDAKRYLGASNMRNQRTGKVLEAVLAFRLNKYRAVIGNPNRVLVTAAAGYPAHPFDLVDVGLDDVIHGKYQAKLGWQATIKALLDPKYEDMTVLTTRESFATIERELRKAEAEAARRSLPLSRKWQAVRDAILQKRLPGTWAGKPLPTHQGLVRLAEKQVERGFHAGDRAAAKSPTAAGRSRILAGLSGRLLGRAFVVVDLTGMSYREYHDVRRFQSGEIGGNYLLFKSTLRAAQVWATLVAVSDPEPITKVGAAATALALAAADAASDAVFQQRQAAAALLLSDIDREERYHAARLQLVVQDKASVIAGDQISGRPEKITP